LVPNDNNNSQDIFVRNMLTGTTSLVSVNSVGGSGNAPSTDARISADGRRVVFQSYASDLVSNDTNGYVPDVFVRELLTNTTRLVSVSNTGGSGNSDSAQFTLSADGRYVAFISFADNLLFRTKDTNGRTDVFLRDLDAETTTLVSISRVANRSSNLGAFQPTISADGRFVCFQSSSTDLTANSTNGLGDVFVRDTVLKTTTLVSVNLNGVAHSGYNGIQWSGMSANGRVVLFTAWDTDVVEQDNNGRLDLFARDLATGTTQLVSSKVPRTAFPLYEQDYFRSPVISPDGRFVVFCINRTDITAQKNLYLRDLTTGSLSWLNPNTGYSGADHPAISADGRIIAFESYASDLLPNIGGNGNVYAYGNAFASLAEEGGVELKQNFK
ncbi:MAG: PD40 domain-containing protein, partial [Acidobacteria bacterium]|nr:PD40 domain-containing protein [Acidobacteriota bacterium]